MSEKHTPENLAGDILSGAYAATGTVVSSRRNLFHIKPGAERHICTLVSGSKSQVQRFDEDCERIVRALDSRDDMLAALKDGLASLDKYLGATKHVTGIEPVRKDLIERGNAMEAAIAKAEGRDGAA